MSTSINIKANPVLLDKPIQDLQTLFVTNLIWLNYAFGKAYRLVKTVDSKEYIYPAVYKNHGEYYSVLPDDVDGNFCFFEIDDPQEFEPFSGGTGSLKVLTIKASIIFWYRLDTIYSDDTMHYGEEVKKDILTLLAKPGLLKNGRISITNVYERAENIYRGYSIKQIDHQYLMYPYSGLRVECELKVQELC